MGEDVRVAVGEVGESEREKQLEARRRRHVIRERRSASNTSS